MSSGFHEVSFPMSLAFGTTGGPERRNDIVLLSNGFESRNARWRSARRRFDAGSGIKSADDLYRLVAFYEARQGSLYGFRFRVCSFILSLPGIILKDAVLVTPA